MFTGRVLRVYLDQNKWIDLARTDKDDPAGRRYRDVLDLASAAVEAGDASFPLDISRYMETAKRGDWASRQELAATMARLSRFHAIAPQTVLVPTEIDAALHARFGRPKSPRTAQVFGIGAGHAFGGGISTKGRLKLPDGARLPPGARALLDAAMEQTLEHALLLGATPGMQQSDDYQALLARMTQDAQFAQGRTDLAGRLTKHGYDKKERLDRAMHAAQLQDILAPVLEALHRAQLDPDTFLDTLGRDGLTQFIRDLPTRAVTVDLLRDKHAQGQQRWEPNDLNDIVSLPAAAVHCDVVVTERQWANRMIRARVPQRYGTAVLSDLADLAPLLAAASRTG